MFSIFRPGFREKQPHKSQRMSSLSPQRHRPISLLACFSHPAFHHRYRHHTDGFCLYTKCIIRVPTFLEDVLIKPSCLSLTLQPQRTVSPIILLNTRQLDQSKCVIKRSGGRTFTSNIETLLPANTNLIPHRRRPASTHPPRSTRPKPRTLAL